MQKLTFFGVWVFGGTGIAETLYNSRHIKLFFIMKKLLFSMMLFTSITAFCQPITCNSNSEVGTYTVPSAASSWINFSPSSEATCMLKQYNNGTSIDWGALKNELNSATRTGDLQVLSNSLNSYLPSGLEYGLAGARLCCVYSSDNCGGIECCWSYNCDNCECIRLIDDCDDSEYSNGN